MKMATKLHRSVTLNVLPWLLLRLELIIPHRLPVLPRPPALVLIGQALALLLMVRARIVLSIILPLVSF
jgi:hypothetical protein